MLFLFLRTGVDPICPTSPLFRHLLYSLVFQCFRPLGFVCSIPCPAHPPSSLFGSCRAFLFFTTLIFPFPYSPTRCAPPAFLSLSGGPIAPVGFWWVMSLRVGRVQPTRIFCAPCLFFPSKRLRLAATQPGHLTVHVRDTSSLFSHLRLMPRAFLPPSFFRVPLHRFPAFHFEPTVFCTRFPFSFPDRFLNFACS